MEVKRREEAVSLLASAHNHGDLAVKLSSLGQLQHLITSSSSSIISSSFASHVFPFLVDLQSSPHPLVRKLLLQIIEEIGLSNLEHSSLLIPVLLALLKDGDPNVANQSIVSGTKFFSAVLEELAWQFHRHGKVQRWTEEMWIQMIEFKDAVLCLVFEPVSVGTRLLALKFLENFVLLFTFDESDSDRGTSGGSEVRFNISWLASGHPVLDASKLISEANRLFDSILDMLHSFSLIPGPLTIGVINCLATIARKRPDHYDKVLPAILDFHSKSETSRTGHAASLQYSVRTALLGFLRCTHPVIIESRDKLVRFLRSMNVGEAVDQALRHVVKIMRNNERSLREIRAIKEDQSSTQIPYSGDPMKRKLMSMDNEEPSNDSEVALKRMRYNSNGKFSDPGQMNEPADDTHVNGTASDLQMLNHTNPVEQMIVVIGALLAEGERGVGSLDLLITQIHPDLLADIVISNMKHLPKTPPTSKSESMLLNGQSSSAASIVELTAPDCTTVSVHSSVTSQGSNPTSAVSASLPDVSNSTFLPADSKRDPRRDPRRLDPRRVVVPVEASPPSLAVETVNLHSRLDGPTFVNKSRSSAATLNVEHILPPVPDADNEDSMPPSLVSGSEKEVPKEETVDGAREPPSSTLVDVLADRLLSPVLAQSATAEMSLDIMPTDATIPSFVPDFDDYSPPAADASASASEEICVDLPQVPPYVDLSLEERQTVIKLAVARILRSCKELIHTDISKTRMAILARLISLMEADDLVITMVQEYIVLDYRDQQGHEFVMHVLYHLHSLMAKESSDHFPGAAVLYEKFLLGVAESLLNTQPASDKSFSRLLGEAPTLTDSVMRLLENLCCPDGSDKRGNDNRDDRVTQGLGAVWSLILGRPLNRQACLDIALKCAVHSEDDTRAKAIRLVANKLYQLHYLSETIEQYATNMLLSAVDADAAQCMSTGPKKDVGFDEDPSADRPQLSDPVYFENVVKAAHPLPQTGVSISLGEAQRLISLYFALCMKKPALLQLVFDVYVRSGRSVKQAIHRHIPIFLRSLGSSYSQLLRIISNPPAGSENLLMLVLQILADQTTPPPDLINTVKQLYETKLKDATILIPLLSSLPKHEVLPIFPRLVHLPLDKFQQALANILQGSAHTGPALTPAEVLVAIHDIVPEKEGVALKKVTDACSACFEQRTVFTQQVLAKALNQMVDRTTLPLLFMRTVIQAIDAFPSLVDFVMEVLSKLVSRQIWRMPKLWPGFLKCISQTQPHSFHVLLQLPVPQLESALNKYANLRGPLATYSSQPSIRSSLPRPTLAVLGLVNE